MPFRVNDILLVSSLYDSFILREDGRLNELLIGESLELDLHQVPGITHVSSGRGGAGAGALAAALQPDRHQPADRATWTPRNWRARSRRPASTCP